MAGPAFTHRARFLRTVPHPPRALRCASRAAPPSRGLPFGMVITKYSILNKVINH